MEHICKNIFRNLFQIIPHKRGIFQTLLNRGHNMDQKVILISFLNT